MCKMTHIKMTIVDIFESPPPPLPCTSTPDPLALVVGPPFITSHCVEVPSAFHALRGDQETHLQIMEIV
jgi:hypothetical protein